MAMDDQHHPPRPRYRRQMTVPPPSAAVSPSLQNNKPNSPWITRVASVESLHFAALHQQHAPSSSGQSSTNNHTQKHPSSLLKKRHSTYTLSSAASSTGMERTASLPPPLPPPSDHRIQDLQMPTRPPRNPARNPISGSGPSNASSSSFASVSASSSSTPPSSMSVSIPPPVRRSSLKSKSRPSTADSSAWERDRERHRERDREEVTPWEFQSLKEDDREGDSNSLRDIPSPRTPVTPSLKSRASSSAGFALGVATGPVEEVTPWELYPVPAQQQQQQQPPAPSNTLARSESNRSGSGKSDGESGNPNANGRRDSKSEKRKSKIKTLSSSSKKSSGSNASSSSNLQTPTPLVLSFSASAGYPAYPSTPMPGSIASGSGSGSGYSHSHSSAHNTHGHNHNPSPSSSAFGFAPSYSSSSAAASNAFLPHSPSTSTLGSAVSVISGYASGTGSGSASASASASGLPTTPLKASFTSTGPVEDVTPWELHPAPVAASSSSSGPGVGVDGSEGGARRASVDLREDREMGQGRVYANANANANTNRRSVDMSFGIGGVSHLRSRTGAGSGAGAGTGTGTGAGMGAGGVVGSVIGGFSLKGRRRGNSVGASSVSASSAASLAAAAGSESVPPLPLPLPVPVSLPPPLPQTVPTRQGQSQYPSPGRTSNPVPNSVPAPAGVKVNTSKPAATGPMEEVTPWELEDRLPSPLAGADAGSNAADQSQAEVDGVDVMSVPTKSTSGSGGGRQSGRPRGSMTVEQLEEVMPWELYPAPERGGDRERERERTAQAAAAAFANANAPVSSASIAAASAAASVSASGNPRQSTAGSAFADFGLRRRRSTGGGSVGGGVVGAAGKAKSVKDREREREREVKDREREKNRMSTSGLGLGIGTGISSTSIFPPPVSSSSPISPVGPSLLSLASSTSSSTKNASGSGSALVLDATQSASASAPSSSTSNSTPTPTTAAGLAHAQSQSQVHPPGQTHTHTQAQTQTQNQAQGQQAPKFSTADRTILEQLKANLQAREAQFVVKGVGHAVVGGGYSPGKKHHPYRKEEVPYPRSYGREVVDLDVWETMFALDMCESLTWHVFETPPTKVLELGCGTGTWILHCARTWKECHFVGLDIVPLHPDLQNVGSPDLASRITWVQHNFLDGLPFQNEEFDFVHIKRIALGVPEHKWDGLFEEIARVMKPGGALELVEEDLFFPGKLADDGDESFTTFRDDSSSVTRRNSTSSDRHRVTANGQDELDQLEHVSEADSPETPTTMTQNMLNPRGPSRPASPTRGREPIVQEDMPPVPKGYPHPPPQPVASSSTATLLYPPIGAPLPLYTPHSRSAARPALSVKTQRQTLSSDPYADLAASHPNIFGSSVSVLGGIGYLPSQDPFMELLKQQKRERAAAAAALKKGNSQPSPVVSVKPTVPKVSPFLLRSLTKSPTNPRDHTILQAVWNGMLEARWVNQTPLSILTTTLEYHFKDVRTHMPLQYTFPPVPVKPEEEDSEDEDNAPTPQQPSDSEPDTDDARDAVVVMPKKPRSTKSRKSANSNASTALSPHSDENGELPEEHRWLSMQGLLQHSSPYVSLDQSQGYAFSPSNKAGVPQKKTAMNRPMSRLPNMTLHIDLRTLNLHLALRAKEVIACSESMWEYVQEYQARSSKDAASSGRLRSGSGSIEGYMVGVQASESTSSLDQTQNAILEMTRDDFDHLLNNFEMDMQDKASVGHALQERFNWHVFPSPILQDRKAFDVACEKYDKWLVAERKAKQSTELPYPQHRSRNSMSSPVLIPPTPESSVSHDSNIIARSSSSPHPAASERLSDDTSSLATTLVPSSNRHDSTASHNAPLVSPSVSHMSAQSSVTQRLSRKTRVFVAWKPEAPY
ncbi:hypothetical protein GALMADRAFT_238570 [Galerina marginata CBS 339.88]|uniref:Methyltransferase domain-containing protein n=1 Tax=Galerina marginata (strain CBS 339.88) TaxID=685588 RepID=A0A067TIE9_GALM3|nr:hypothetical protein GALMADRAFT_238570 [Galerina marginata CBS 339.88]